MWLLRLGNKVTEVGRHTAGPITRLNHLLADDSMYAGARQLTGHERFMPSSVRTVTWPGTGDWCLGPECAIVIPNQQAEFVMPMFISMHLQECDRLEAM